MLKNLVFIGLAAYLMAAPTVQAQSAFNPSYTADAGESALLHQSATTNTQLPQSQAKPWADASVSAPGTTQLTGNQGAGRMLPNLPPVVTGMPQPGTKKAGGSIALKNQGLDELPDTSTGILSGSGGAIGAAEAVVGDEGAYMNGYSRKNAIEKLLSPGLTTGHKAKDLPRVSDEY